MKTLAAGLLVVSSVLVAPGAIAQQGINAPPDAIFYNGKIITVDSGFTIAQAFAVRGGEYVAVGTDAAIRPLARANTRLIDLKGSAVTPGLSDNHDHLYNSAKVMRGIDLVGATSTAEVVKRLRNGFAKAKPAETVFGSVGWRAPLTRNDLDQISADVPIVALRARRGAAVMNSAALKKAGISKDMQSYMGKEIPKDSSGELTGETPDYPAGLFVVDKVVPLPTPGEEEQWIEAGQKQRNALGITSIRDLSNWPHAMRAFERIWRQGRLTVRVSLGLELAVSDPADLARQQMVTPGFGDHWLRIDSAGERPHPPEGDATLEEYKALMLELNRLGWRHSPHVGTNEALEEVLQAYEAADRESPIRDRRWVVEHIPNVTPALMSGSLSSTSSCPPTWRDMLGITTPQCARLVSNRRGARRRCGKCSITIWWSLPAAITADPLRTQRHPIIRLSRCITTCRARPATDACSGHTRKSAARKRCASLPTTMRSRPGKRM